MSDDHGEDATRGRNAVLIAVVLAVVLAGCSTGKQGAVGQARTERRAEPQHLASPGCADAGEARPGRQVIPYSAVGERGRYIRDIPAGYDDTQPTPVVLDLHGYLSTAAMESALSELATFGDSHGFITITPQVDAAVQHWDVDPAGRDVAYLAALLTDVERSACVDLRRVYVAGLSNGAWMASTVACKLADRVAAVAPVAGLQDIASCRPRRPVPVVTFHGTADAFVAYEGGWGRSGWTLPALDGSGRTFAQAASAHRPITFGPRPESIPHQVATWARHNGCGARPRQYRITVDVTRVAYSCAADASVEFYRIAGGGHVWPGSKTMPDPTTVSVSANEIIWRFFLAHPLEASDR